MKVQIIKQNLQGFKTYRYAGEMVIGEAGRWVVEAFFDRDDLDLFGLRLRKGDRFVESYYPDRWYNIFEIYDWESGERKGWYCNISSPAAFADGQISYRDLALDLLVFADGRQLVLDEDEFAALALSDGERAQALAALRELQGRFSELPGNPAWLPDPVYR